MYSKNSATRPRRIFIPSFLGLKSYVQQQQKKRERFLGNPTLPQPASPLDDSCHTGPAELKIKKKTLFTHHPY